MSYLFLFGSSIFIQFLFKQWDFNFHLCRNFQRGSDREWREVKNPQDAVTNIWPPDRALVEVCVLCPTRDCQVRARPGPWRSFHPRKKKLYEKWLYKNIVLVSNEQLTLAPEKWISLSIRIRTSAAGKNQRSEIHRNVRYSVSGTKEPNEWVGGMRSIPVVHRKIWFEPVGVWSGVSSTFIYTL